MNRRNTASVILICIVTLLFVFSIENRPQLEETPSIHNLNEFDEPVYDVIPYRPWPIGEITTIIGTTAYNCSANGIWFNVTGNYCTIVDNIFVDAGDNYSIPQNLKDGYLYNWEV